MISKRKTLLGSTLITVQHLVKIGPANLKYEAMKHGNISTDREFKRCAPRLTGFEIEYFG